MREQIRLPVADSYNNLGAIAATNNDYASAVKFFERAAEWNPTLDGLDYNWGRAAFAGSQFAEAIPPLSRYVSSHPEDLGGRAVLGISEFMAGNYRGCIEALQPAIGKPGVAPQAEYVYAESLVRTDQVASGIERLRAIEKSHPEILDVHQALADAYTAASRPDDAQKEIEICNQLKARTE